MAREGFKEAKRKVLKALADGAFQHEARNNIDIKNELLAGTIAAIELAAVIRRTNGKNHSMSAHHRAASVTVHVIKREGWYIKFYFIDPDTWFISVHTIE